MPNMEQPAAIIDEDDPTQPGWCHNNVNSQDFNPSLSQPPTDCPAVYYVESKIWTHVTIVMYVSLCNSNISAHEKQ